MENLDPNVKLPVTLTRIRANGDPIMSMDGAVTLPIGTRVEVWEDGKAVDYIIDNVRLRHEGTQAGLYYDTHRAATVGTSAATDHLPPV